MQVLRLSTAGLFVACLTAALLVAADERPRPPRSMPISKYWRRGFVTEPRVNQTRVPRVPPVGVTRKIDLNSCTLDQIQNLPGVSASMGARILAGRPYRGFDDLLRQGVPLSTVDQFRGQVYFGP